MKHGITPKQLEVLKLITEGYNSSEIAVKLENSKKTIDSIRSSMLLRFGCTNVAQLVSYGFRNGFLE